MKDKGRRRGLLPYDLNRDNNKSYIYTVRKRSGRAAAAPRSGKCWEGSREGRSALPLIGSETGRRMSVARKETQQYMTALESMYMRHMQGGDDVRSGVVCYRTRTIRSGDMLECISYPVYKRQEHRRNVRAQQTGAAMQEINRRNAVRRMERLVQCNFGRNAIILTCTYEGQSPEQEAAEKELDRYLVRLRRAAKSSGQALKYVAVTERASTGRIHHHLIAEGVSRDEAERKWRSGFCNARRYQQRTEQFIGIVRYMLKYRSTQDALVSRRIRVSHGMAQPVETVSDHRVSLRKMEQICRDMQDGGTEVLRRIYPGYDLRERPEIRRSDFMPGAYMYARLWRVTV